MQANDWIIKLLHARDISLPDNRLLYQYQLSHDEFECLKQTLKVSAMLGVQHIFKDIKHWDAAFVLYAAEWWRREYDGSSWKWENIFASFGGDVKELNTSQRNILIEKGLSYWRRNLRVINGRRRYLGSIAIEGGLPLKQLTNTDTKGGWLGRIFKQAIPKYIKFKSSGVTATEIVREYAHYCPQTFRNEEIFSILGDMLEAVVTLKVNHQLHEKTNPIAYLNQHVNGWQEQFPLPIDDQVSSKLLSEMISTAVTATETRSKAFTVNRLLNDQYHLEMTIEFERFIALETIFAGISKESIPLRLELEIISDNENTVSLGYALKTTIKGKASLKMPRLKYDVPAQNTNLYHAIRFKHLSETVKEIPLLGAENLDNELPWIFNEKWVLEGTASASIRAKQVRILYPENLICEAENQIFISRIGQKKLVEASGIIRLMGQHDTVYVIRTGQPHSPEQYYLQGKTLNFNSQPKDLYIGLPTLRCLNIETDATKEIPTADLVAKPLRSAEVLNH